MKASNLPPLISPSELSQLRSCLLNNTPLHARGQTALSGRYKSLYRGHGMDWVDTRAYQAGDDLRHLDWRATARSGKATTKVFQEERQRKLLLVVDRRQTMAFGTTVDLKATVAARAAAIIAFSAIANSEEVLGIVIEDGVSIYPAARTNETLLPLLRAISKPLQPATTPKNQSSWQQLFTTIEHLGGNACSTIFISDFVQLIESSQQRLQHLALQQEVAAIYITDPAEEQLKNIGTMNIVCPLTGKASQIDTCDKKLRQRYEHAMTLGRSELFTCFKKAAIPYHMLSTAQETFKQLQKWQWTH
ncbi:MAG: DUF58 domain-containing protein [Gammaproteobacteria bacterium]|nr:DUF58 domain-containing protein [Gammaproteobacteria bacterium]